jgi:hypothetical protein
VGVATVATVKVYKFARYDNSAPVVPEKRDTLKAIDSLFRCRPLMATEREVDESSLDPAGFAIALAGPSQAGAHKPGGRSNESTPGL